MPLSLLSNTLLAWRFFKKIYLSQTIDVLLMPLDDPTIAVVVPVDDPKPNDDCDIVDDNGFEITGHWVGAHGDWIAFAERPGRWYLQNVYTMVKVELPPVQRVGIEHEEAQWHPCPPFTYYYQHARIELLKIQITKVPISKYFYHLSSHFWNWLCWRFLFTISLGPRSLLIIILLLFFN